MKRIYTRGGDGGDTSLFGGSRVRKWDRRVAAYGVVDELSSFLGLAIAELNEAEDDAETVRTLRTIQHRLFSAAGALADPEGRAGIDPPGKGEEAELEKAIDRLEEGLPPLTSFILPGGSSPGALLQVSRAVCRRAERAVVELADSGEPVPAGVVPYLNRLSDYLFVAARAVNVRRKEPEATWDPDL